MESDSFIHITCGRHVDVISRLIQANADLNRETRAGLTPLHVAAIYGQVDVCAV